MMQSNEFTQQVNRRTKSRFGGRWVLIQVDTGASRFFLRDEFTPLLVDSKKSPLHIEIADASVIPANRSGTVYSYVYDTTQCEYVPTPWKA